MLCRKAFAQSECSKYATYLYRSTAYSMKIDPSPVSCQGTLIVNEVIIAQKLNLELKSATVLISVVSTDAGDIIRLSTDCKDVVKTLSSCVPCCFVRIGNLKVHKIQPIHSRTENL